MKTLKATIQFLKENISSNRFEKIKKTLEDDEFLLLEGILHQDFPTDTEAAMQVFGLKSNSITYQKTKKKLQKTINEHSIFVDPSLKNLPKSFKVALEQSVIECLIKVYDYYNQRELNIALIESNFQIAYKFYLNSTIIAMCKKLITFYGSVNHNPKLLTYYSKVYSESCVAFNAECISDLYYQTINNQFGKTQSINKVNMMKEIESYITELKPYENKIRSQIFHANFYNLHMVYHHIQHEYRVVVEICDQLIRYISTLPFKSVGLLKQTLKRKASHLIMLGSHEEALKVLNEVLPMESKGSPQWINCHYLLLSIHVLSKDYTLADEYAQDLINNKQYRSAKSIFKPLIDLINVYLYLFKLMHIIPNNLEEGHSEVKKYMKEHVSYTKDKIGMNIPVVIAQLIEAIVLRRESEILDRIEALKKYSSRYIIKNNSLRSNCFMNMLIEVVKHNYHLAAIERHTKKYYTKLLANPKISSEEAAEIELIPYEDLWAILMDFIKSKRKA